MTFPSQIQILNLSLNTFGIFVLLGFLLLAYVVWKEGKRDGFTEEKLFDLLLLSLTFAILLSRAIFAFYTSRNSGEFFGHILKIWTPGFNPYGALVGFIVPIYILCKSWKWSLYRILDIFSLGASLALSVILLAFVGFQSRFEFLFAFAFLIILFVLLSKLRIEKIKSGYTFCLFLLGFSGLGFVFFRQKNDLIFYSVLVTLASVVFLFRWRLENETSGLVGTAVRAVKARISKQKKSV